MPNNTNKSEDRIIADAKELIGSTIDNLIEIIEDLDTRLSDANSSLQQAKDAQDVAEESLEEAKKLLDQNDISHNF